MEYSWYLCKLIVLRPVHHPQNAPTCVSANGMERTVWNRRVPIVDDLEISLADYVCHVGGLATSFQAIYQVIIDDEILS